VDSWQLTSLARKAKPSRCSMHARPTWLAIDRLLVICVVFFRRGYSRLVGRHQTCPYPPVAPLASPIFALLSSIPDLDLSPLKAIAITRAHVSCVLSCGHFLYCMATKVLAKVRCAAAMKLWRHIVTTREKKRLLSLR